MANLVADPHEIKQAMAKIHGLQVPSPPALLLNISNELTKPEPDKKKIIGMISNRDCLLLSSTSVMGKSGCLTKGGQRIFPENLECSFAHYD